MSICRATGLLAGLLLAVAAAAQPKEDIRYRETFNQLITDGRFVEAEANARATLADFEARYGPESLETAKALNMLTEVYFYGDHVRDLAGEEFALRCIAIKKKLLGPEDIEVADALRMYGRLLFTKGDYERARSNFERAVAIYLNNSGKDPRLEAYAYDAYGSVLMKSGDFTEARAWYDRALSIREKYFPPITMNTAGLLSDYGALLGEMGQYEQARAMLQRSVSIFEQKMGADHVNVTEPLMRLGALLNRIGRPAEAKPLLERSLAIEEKAYGPDHIEVAFVLHELAVSHVALGDYADARPLYERSIAIATGVYGPEHPDVAQILSGYADLLRRMGDYRLALDAALRTEEIGRNHLMNTMRTLPERQALYYARTRATATDTLIRVALAYPPARRRVYDALIRSRALVFDEMAARHRNIGRESAPETARLWDAVASARRRLSRVVIQGPVTYRGKEYAAALLAARADCEAAERALAEHSAAFRNELARRGAGLDDVSGSLSPGDALVSFLQYHPAEARDLSYVAFVQRYGQTDPAVIPLGPASNIIHSIEEVRNQVEAEAESAGRSQTVAETRYRVVGTKLRERVWDPLTPALAHAHRVFLAADGELNRVDFAALPARGPGYLVEHGPLMHYLSAERDLIPTTAREGQGLLAIGAPAFDRTPREPELVAALDKPVFRGGRSTCMQLSSLRFPPLPASMREVRDIGALWNRADAGAVMERTGEAANEFEFERNAPGRRVLHIAAHAFSIGDGCEESSFGGAAENPLLLSGIAFAGANRRHSTPTYDGIVTAEEIAAMNLSGVEWAVLSACETGLGKEMAGEGVFGLRRAFQVAGARTVITSLWAVDDSSTEQWMVELYRNRFAAHKNTAESVRAASLSMLARRRAAGLSTHPFYWSGFIAVGDWR